MFFWDGTPSTTPNLDLDEIKTQLQELQSNMRNEMIELKQGFRSSLSTTKKELMNEIPGNEKTKQTFFELVKDEIENTQRIETMENEIKSNKETFATIDTTIMKLKENNENKQQQLEKSITDNMESIRQTIETTANDFGKKNDTTKGIVNILEIKHTTTEKKVKDFEMKFSTQEQLLDNMPSFIEDAKQQVEQLNIAMDKSKEVLKKYGDTQKIIQQNTFDKGIYINRVHCNNYPHAFRRKSGDIVVISVFCPSVRPAHYRLLHYKQ
ncbi:hypothetical protein DPMN_074980 [Dreissena polymorpha]|uniref:Uncharacterized protein n=1 Tax=Dreissena polymorpha TaxID=45954 RepID=A0A9D3YGC2_DREPO|nr:hypothetical protein DPMN_074980 [Dreissena polymorpha]